MDGLSTSAGSGSKKKFLERGLLMSSVLALVLLVIWAAVKVSAADQAKSKARPAPVDLAKPLRPAPDLARQLRPAPDLARQLRPAPDLARQLRPAPDLAKPLRLAPDLARPLHPAADLARPLHRAPDLAKPLQPAADLAKPMHQAADLAKPIHPITSNLANQIRPSSSDLAKPLPQASVSAHGDLTKPLHPVEGATNVPDLTRPVFKHGEANTNDLTKPLQQASSSNSPELTRPLAAGTSSTASELTKPLYELNSSTRPVGWLELAQAKAKNEHSSAFPDGIFNHIRENESLANSSAVQATPEQANSAVNTPASLLGAIQTPAKEEPSVLSTMSEISGLQSLEERLFSRTFTMDSTNDRLLRLEKFVFGVEGKGDTKARVDKLSNILMKASSSSRSASGVAIEEKPKGLLGIINHGIDNYNRHRYHNAEDDFNDALVMAPGVSRVHVYLGITLLQLNQHQAAIDALKAGYEIDPFGTYGRYAKNALIMLMGDEEVRQRGPKDDLKTVSGLIGTVNRQADQDSARHGKSGDRRASNTMLTANNNVNRLSRETLGASRDFGMRAMFIRADAAVMSARYRQDAAQRAANTQESANNLKLLLTQKLLPGDAKLRAFGTSLNARYYGDETRNLAPWYIPREAPLELKAQPVLLKALSAGQVKAIGSKHSHSTSHVSNKTSKSKRRAGK